MRGLSASIGVVVPTLLIMASNIEAHIYDDAIPHPAIPLLDEDGNHVLDSGRPYSSRTSCGTAGCHDYDGISKAYHIEQGRDEADDQYGVRHGLPQLVSGGYFGGYNCMSGNNPDILAKKNNAGADDFADLGSAGWIRLCSSCHSGGGWAEKDRQGRRYNSVDPATVAPFDGDYYNRGTDANNQPTGEDVVAQWDWQRSGVVENDCFQCHADYSALATFGPQPEVMSHGHPIADARGLLEHVRNTELMDSGLFRFANSSTLAYLDIDTSGDPDNATALVTFERDTGETANPLRLDAEGEPVLHWNGAAFDANRKATIPMRRYPASHNCMQCHYTAQSRRGFYGFGEDYLGESLAAADGAAAEKQDVHYGKTWTEANGEERALVNCNGCHARNYYNPVSANVDLDANHDFLKGNADTDVRNDLDYAAPGIRTCRYCHDDAEQPAIPSGHADMLSAHRERWKLSGDLEGYPGDTLTQITATHLDTLSCQACHVTDKVYGAPLEPMFRYRRGESGDLEIVPTNPKFRYYWQDRSSGRVLAQHERNRVFEQVDQDDCAAGGNIVHPVTGEVLGTVPAYFSHGACRFDDPQTYDGFVALKGAYDALLADIGVTAPDAQLVYKEVNAYLLTHNTRAAVSAVQCEQCHNRKQDGSFSSLVSPDGLLGENHIVEVATLPDPRLVDEGIVVLGHDYLRIDGDGRITASAADMLTVTKMDPSMSALGVERVDTFTGAAARADLADTLDHTGLGADQALLSAILGDEAYAFVPNYGDPRIRQTALLVGHNQVTAATVPGYRFLVGVEDGVSVQGADTVFRIEAQNVAGTVVGELPDTFVVKLPYGGPAAAPAEVRVVHSGDGEAWQGVDSADVLAVHPAAGGSDGYVLLSTRHFSYFAITAPADIDDDPDSGSDTGTGSGGGGGGAALFLPLLAVAALWGRRRSVAARARR